MLGRKFKIAEVVLETIKLSSLCLVTGLLISACGNKSGDSAPAPVVVQPLVNPTCLGTTCLGSAGAEIFRGDSAGGLYGSSNQLSLVFVATNYAQPVQPMLGQPGYPNATLYPNYPGYNNGYNSLSPTSYSGGVTVQGTLTVTSTMWSNTLLPAGSYSVTSIQQGTWMSATYSNVRVQITPLNGLGFSAVATLSGMVGAKSPGYWGSMWSEIPRQGTIMGQLVFESINGQPYTNLMNY